jgi:hypothetical protein
MGLGTIIKGTLDAGVIASGDAYAVSAKFGRQIGEWQ